MPIQGQAVVVTGAAQGIGERVARTLSARGANLLLGDIQEHKVAGVARDLRCASTRVDISDCESACAMIATAIDVLGHVDALVNVAGIDAPYVQALEVTPEHWREIIDVNLSGPWWCTAAVLPHMVERGTGRVVTISSACAVVGFPDVSPAYSAAKAGLIGLVTALSSNLERHGILLNAIAPGYIGTTGTPTPPAEASRYEADYPLGFGGPQPVADAVAYLLDDSGSWISGAVLNVSGGLVRGR